MPPEYMFYWYNFLNILGLMGLDIDSPNGVTSSFLIPHHTDSHLLSNPITTAADFPLLSAPQHNMQMMNKT